MYELKRLSKDAIPSALAKAERYRLLNEPAEAESICDDVLAVDPENQQALVMLLLALTDQFPEDGLGHVARAQEIVTRLRDPYDRAYYAGIVSERRARALLAHRRGGSGGVAADWFHDALRQFEAAIAIRPAGNDDAILRWNACARVLNRLPATELREVPEAILSE
ncbi:MAG TPA: hypothetical protein VIL35_16875 [Vicinamibacterales bacterium]